MSKSVLEPVERTDTQQCLFLFDEFRPMRNQPMLRLFVAADFPTPAVDALAAIRPLSLPGIRPVEPAQIHLTLHFLGDSDPTRIGQALKQVCVPSFMLTLNGVGRFDTREGGSILWAGIEQNPALVSLHSAIADALIEEGYKPESRPYSPHITLARCQPRSDSKVIETFLNEHRQFVLDNLLIDSFALYSSQQVGHRREYRVEQRYPLPAMS